MKAFEFDQLYCQPTDYNQILAFQMKAFVSHLSVILNHQALSANSRTAEYNLASEK